ncbi:hypothetical protein [Segatella bryantii]|uniref:hypothetical protein n=1 Tax=Segatella bryantii TaxID=77095 RepID=UPI0021086E83|nr:hypothetical protein [Segatella bryantii]
MSGSVVSCVNQLRHAVSDGDGRRVIAIRERQSANTRHAIADCGGCKARVISECMHDCQYSYNLWE